MANVKVPPFTEAPSTVVGGTPTSVFPFDFPFWAAADILVYVDGVQLDAADYSVEGFYLQGDPPAAVEGGYGSGEVTLDTPVTSCTVTIDRLVVGDRETQFSRSVPLGMPALNGDLNRLTARQQDLDRQKLTTPAFDRAGKFLAFDGDGKPVAASGTGADAGLRSDLAGSGGSSLVDFLQAGIGAVARALQTWLRERPVSVLDYYEAGDGADYGPAFGRALTASPRVFWPYNASGYAISSAVSRTLTRDVIIDWNGQQVTFSAAVDLAGATVADVSVTLAANPARYATSVQITGGSSASVQAGDILNIQSSVVPFSDAPDTKQDTVRIRSVSGSGPYTLTLDAGLNFPWSSAESGIVVSIFRPVKVTHLRPNVVITETDGAGVSKYAVRHTGLRDITITSPVIKGNRPFTPSVNFYRTGFQLYYCVGWTVTDGVYEAVSYPLGVYGGTRNGMEINSKARFCRHSHADMGGFASDYRLIGLHDEDSFVALSTHPAFRCYAEAFDVRNNTALTAWRCMGGALKNGSVHTTDSTSDTPQIQSWVPNSGFEYVYDDADFEIDGVTFDNPSRTAPDVYVHYGRNVRLANTKAIDIRIGSTVDLYLNGEGNRLTGGKASPQSTLVLSPSRVDGVAILDGYLLSSVYHIDPYRSIVAQSNKRLTCSGQVFRDVVQGTYAVRLHVNGITGVNPVYLQGDLMLTGIVQHESAGFYSEIKNLYTFGLALGGGGFVRMTTTPIQVIGPATGAGGTDITLAISGVSYTDAGSGGDSYISFSVAIATVAGVTNPAFGLEYDLTLRETFAT